MFKPFDDPKGCFSFQGLPSKFFLDPSPFGNGALLILHQYANNAMDIDSRHVSGVKQAVAQVRETFGESSGALEFYGITDRTGSDSYNKTLSTTRARNALNRFIAELGFTNSNHTFSNGLGESFDAEYFDAKDGTAHAGFRGVACYFWESSLTARDPVLTTSIAFAKPHSKGSAQESSLLGPLHLGRLRANPRSTFGI
ncbi:OmpA family protein [Methylobacterium dankookense]|uniref:Uncharacterized protein n=1 Tax=Methylobacterium dankookense TaxID=560405 RepID=A0A564G2P5_9HYPH|nr:OmpA family protein [Methylobacterium dankookense]GJD54755.1 hypothetical protein IFDJLNFL_0634 [Methylobacterium dankookense]VUF14228.1 hypothetical protein MTDSW087_03946 [Methylobacterium dankookense]